MNVAFCSSEVFPFAKTGGLADVSGALPIALHRLGVDIRIFLPLYGSIDVKKFKLRSLSDKVMTTELDGVPVYFLKHDAYFAREGLYGDAQGDFPDNLERYAWFCREVFEQCKTLSFMPNVFHCNEWETALIPVYLKEKWLRDNFFKKTKTMMTVHNMAYQGLFDKEKFSVLGLGASTYKPETFGFYDRISLLKAGIVYSDLLNTVSPQYAKEIQTQEFGCGLEEVIKNHNGGVKGILNGLDSTVWNPATDIYLEKKYDRFRWQEGKKINKTVLQKVLGLPQRSDVPVMSFIGRLSHQKGMELIIENLGRFLKEDIQIVIQGVGEAVYQRELEAFISDRNKIVLVFEYNEPMAHRIYAGSDIFLMPSLFEPCGLTQMISLMYGTAPVVSSTGGLVDTIAPFDGKTGTGNGFRFSPLNAGAFYKEVLHALEVFQRKADWEKLIENGFTGDFTWDHSAQEYKRSYACVLSA